MKSAMTQPVLFGLDRLLTEPALRAPLAGRRVDILANIAGIQYFGPAERQSAQSIWLGYAVNLIAPVTLGESSRA